MWCDGATVGLFGWTMMVAFWGAIVALVAWVVRSANPPRSGVLALLERRFAAGEIDRDEFEERRSLLAPRS